MDAKKWIIGFMALVACLSAQIKSPEEIQQELNDAEKQFQRAKEMFNPWYSGPLLTGSATMAAPGQAIAQPYFFATDTYGHFNHEREAVSNLHNSWNLNGFMWLQTGLNSWMDTVLTFQYNGNWYDGQQSGGFGDTALQLGVKLLTQGLWVPAIKLFFNEQFPTGRYDNFSSTKLGTQAVGSGTYVTGFTLNMAKLLLWQTLHPLNLRLSLNYYVPTKVHVQGYNTYGGGRGTDGTAHPGQSFKISMGTEFSLTQKWVLSNDVVYIYQGPTRFTGQAGYKADGSPATVGSGSNDQLSLAPAIEYNPTPNLGIIGGAWFSVYGRNAGNFVSAIVSFTYTFSLIN
ncbi:MAG: hypothetical protein KGJ02_05755 [Verrucomicrobiota bacterium]|nr:hypothetical protein [Verrucomicrobiota bacterium]